MKKLIAVITVLLFVCANSYAQSSVQSGTFFSKIFFLKLKFPFGILIKLF